MEGTVKSCTFELVTLLAVSVLAGGSFAGTTWVANTAGPTALDANNPEGFGTERCP